MSKYILDTNIYIRATRNDDWNRALAAFLAAYTPEVYLHSIVAFELLAGALTPALWRRTQSGFIAPFERRKRIITPRHSTWKRAASILTQLMARKRVRPGAGLTRSFVNDCLLAASAHDEGFTLITDNRKDFVRIVRVLPFEVEEPWPGVVPVV